MKKLLFFVLMLSLSFSYTCNDVYGELFEGAWNEASLLFGAVFLFTVAIISISYIYGKSINDAKAILFAKDELFHLFMSIIIVMSVFGLLSVFCHIGSFFFNYTFEGLGIDPATDYCYDNTHSLTDMAICYISTMEGEAKVLVERSIISSVDNEMDSTFIFGFNFPTMGTTLTPYSAYKKAYAMNYDTLNNMFATPALTSVTMQKILLRASLKFSISILLPFAILLRVFFPTRQMGNFLIALVVALQVFLPLLYALNGAMYFHLLTVDDCVLKYSSIISDSLLGGCSSDLSFINFARLIPQTIFLPNLTIAVLVTFLSSINKALRVLG